MKYILIILFQFITISIFAQYRHAIGLQLTGQYYFDGRKFYFNNNPYKTRFPGVNYTFYLDKRNIHAMKISFESSTFDYYPFKLTHGEVMIRRNSILSLSYGYQYFRVKNFFGNINFGFIGRKNVDYFVDYFSINAGWKELVTYSEPKRYHLGNEISTSLNLILLNQLVSSLNFSYIKLYGTYYTDVFQFGIGFSYKF